jgi:hypothetical protein
MDSSPTRGCDGDWLGVALAVVLGLGEGVTLGVAVGSMGGGSACAIGVVNTASRATIVARSTATFRIPVSFA